jgi:hypothetical protein
MREVPVVESNPVGVDEDAGPLEGADQIIGPVEVVGMSLDCGSERILRSREFVNVRTVLPAANRRVAMYFPE